MLRCPVEQWCINTHNFAQCDRWWPNGRDMIQDVTKMGKVIELSSESKKWSQIGPKLSRYDG